MSEAPSSPLLLSPAAFAERYGKKLAIVVPYRDRPLQLPAFVARIKSYFERDKLDRHIDMTLHIVEQHGSAMFNVGKLRNCGYRLARESCDYVCFHDVDYLPIWADYSWSEKPSLLIWYGLKGREDRERFFGAVVQFDNAAFERVNGYPNTYWGWGGEDTELGLRCRLLLGGFEHRDGTYFPLPHPHRGTVIPGILSPEARRNQARFLERRNRVTEMAVKDGLSTLEFKLVQKTQLHIDGAPVKKAFHYYVDIGTPPE